MRKQKRIDARWFSSVLVTCFAVAANAASSSGRDASDSLISVTNIAGDVDVTMAGKAADVAPLDTVLLPARIVTGHDGTFGITQAGTNVNVASDTDVEIPSEAVDGNLVARLVQHRGNVFYDVAPRDAGKLRVETPLLVAVIKGTQFNVAVQPDSTTISLFEGRLEIRTPDGSDVVQLNAGEIAIRSRTDNEIRVVGMNDERVAAPREQRPAFAAALDADAAVRVPDVTSTVLLVDDAVASGTGRDLGLAAKPSVETAGLDLSFASAVDASVNAGVDVGGSVDVGLDARVDLESVTVDVGLDAGVDLGAGTVDIGLDAGVDLGAGTVDVGLDAGVDLGAGTVDVGLDAGVDLGAGTVDLGLDAGVDLGAGTVDVGLDTGVDLGAGAADLGLDAGLDAGLDLGGALDVDVDAGIDLGLADVGVDAGVDLRAGTVDVDLDLGGVLDTGLDLELDLGGTLDLGLDTGGSTPSGPAPPPPSGGLGGLLGGLL